MAATAMTVTGYWGQDPTGTQLHIGASLKSRLPAPGRPPPLLRHRPHHSLPDQILAIEQPRLPRAAASKIRRTVPVRIGGAGFVFPLPPSLGFLEMPRLLFASAAMFAAET